MAMVIRATITTTTINPSQMERLNKIVKDKGKTKIDRPYENMKVFTMPVLLVEVRVITL